MPLVEQRHREAKTGPAVQEFKDDGSLKDMKGAVKHRERYRKKGAVRDSKSDLSPLCFPDGVPLPQSDPEFPSHPNYSQPHRSPPNCAALTRLLPPVD